MKGINTKSINSFHLEKLLHIRSFLMKKESVIVASGQKPSEYLESKGWKRVANVKHEGVNFYLWNHDNHQHEIRGGFTTKEAIHHQKYVDKHNRCACIPKDGWKLRDKPLEIKTSASTDN
jgi:hypothetical protein